MTHLGGSCRRVNGCGSMTLGVALLTLLACIGPATTPETTPSVPVTPADLVDRAEEAQATGDLDTAIDHYREASKRDPSNDRLRRTLAAAHVERARRVRAEQGAFGLEAAEHDLREALRLEPDDPAIRRSLAAVLVDRAVREMSPDRAQELREEARELDVAISRAGQGYRPELERRLDLAFELVERGQLDAGIERLEALHNAYPDHPGATRLLAQSLARKALLRAQRGRHAEAGRLLDRAVNVYAALEIGQPDSDATRELRGEIRDAHRNRIVAWLNAARPEEAQRALAEAEQAGFRFPELARAVGESTFLTR